MRAFLILCVVALPLIAGKRIVSEGGDGKTTRRTEILLDGTRMRVNSEGMSTLVRTKGDGFEFLIIDAAKGQYFDVDRKYFEDLVAGLESLQAKAQESLKRLPPEQRETMMKLLKPTLPVMRYEPSGTEQVNGIPCLLFVQFSGEQKVAETCVAKPGDLGISAAEFRIVEQSGDYQFKMMEGFGDSALGAAIMDLETAVMMNPELRGIPLRTSSEFGGKILYSEKFVLIENVSFTDSDFSVGGAVRAEPPKIGLP